MLILILLWLCQALLAETQQAHLAIASERKYAITPDVKQFAQDLLSDGTIPGMTIGVVHFDGFIETDAFGSKTEDGLEMTPEVRLL